MAKLELKTPGMARLAAARATLGQIGGALPDGSVRSNGECWRMVGAAMDMLRQAEELLTAEMVARALRSCRHGGATGLDLARAGTLEWLEMAVVRLQGRVQGLDEGMSRLALDTAERLQGLSAALLELQARSGIGQGGRPWEVHPARRLEVEEEESWRRGQGSGEGTRGKPVGPEGEVSPEEESWRRGQGSGEGAGRGRGAVDGQDRAGLDTEVPV